MSYDYNQIPYNSYRITFPSGVDLTGSDVAGFEIRAVEFDQFSYIGIRHLRSCIDLSFNNTADLKAFVKVLNKAVKNISCSK